MGERERARSAMVVLGFLPHKQSSAKFLSLWDSAGIKCCCGIACMCKSVSKKRRYMLHEKCLCLHPQQVCVGNREKSLTEGGRSKRRKKNLLILTAQLHSAHLDWDLKPREEA